MSKANAVVNRTSPLAISPDEFRRAGHLLVDRIADFLDSLPAFPITHGESVAMVREALEATRSLPREGASTADLLERAATLLFDHSLFNGHPRFWGYITSSPAPIGMLGELLAAAVNANCERGFSRRWPARSRRKRCAGLRRCSTIRPTAGDSSSAAATWPISYASSRRAR